MLRVSFNLVKLEFLKRDSSSVPTLPGVGCTSYSHSHAGAEHKDDSQLSVYSNELVL